MENADVGDSWTDGLSRPSQGLAVFTALQRQEIPSELLYFPNENHWVLKPADSIEWYDTVLAWMNRWTRR
jgi:dipeptidyl aminopeptidase/acylaminoacyl peptidase